MTITDTRFAELVSLIRQSRICLNTLDIALLGSKPKNPDDSWEEITRRVTPSLDAVIHTTYTFGRLMDLPREAVLDLIANGTDDLCNDIVDSTIHLITRTTHSEEKFRGDIRLFEDVTRLPEGLFTKYRTQLQCTAKWLHKSMELLDQRNSQPSSD